jgi:predicted DNA-binding transcriptional regulator AlpA
MIGTITLNRPLTTREVAALFGVTPQTLRTWVRGGDFPPPFKPGKRKQFWHAADIDKALLAREAAAEKGQT